jgi:guanine nucleotide-binding protein G(i) subunit alpha
MCEYFPDFTGGADYEAACVYLLRQFASLVKSPTKQIYAHYICATDPHQGQCMFIICLSGQGLD